MLKRIFAVLISLIMIFCMTVSLADDHSTPPEMPSGGMMPPGGENGQPPEMPSGGMTPPGGENGQPPEMPGGNAPGGGFGGGTPPGGGTSSFEYTAATEITAAAEVTGETYDSETADESALIVNTADAVSLSEITVNKTGDSDGGDNCNFYGLNAGLLVMGGSVTTSGRSSAAIRTDRGGGTVVVDGGTYTSNGLGSPAIYSTADITVKNATLVSNLSEGVCIEGMNSITLENCDLTANNTQCNGHATFHDTIMIYQSMSGDADSGTSSFTMTGGSLTSLSGHMFHVTNTHAVITLSGVELNNEGSDVLLSACDDGWSGAFNIAELAADSQALSGTILVGDNSTLKLTLTNGSSFLGCISGEIENAQGAAVSAETGTVNVTIDSTSTWTLTADTYITSFEGDAACVNGNGYTLYVNGTALEGIS